MRVALGHPLTGLRVSSLEQGNRLAIVPVPADTAGAQVFVTTFANLRNVAANMFAINLHFILMLGWAELAVDIVNRLMIGIIAVTVFELLNVRIRLNDNFDREFALAVLCVTLELQNLKRLAINMTGVEASWIFVASTDHHVFDDLMVSSFKAVIDPPAGRNKDCGAECRC